jgi:hypothetical protein
MRNKTRNPDPSVRRTILRLDRQLKGVEAQIARIEKDKSLDLAKQDHFLLWQRPSLFAAGLPDVQH